MNSLLSIAISAIITGCFAYITSLSPIKLETVRNRFYKAYNPLFLAVEPTLYKIISLTEAFNQSEIFSQIVSDYPELLDPYLIYRIRKFLADIETETIDQDNYESICQLIDIETDRLKRILKLPRRSFIYKYQFKQLPKFQLDDISSYLSLLKEFLSWIALIPLFLVISLVINFILNFLK